MSKFANHPIQLISVGVKKLEAEAFKFPDLTTEPPEDSFSFEFGSSDFDPEEKTIAVGVKIEIGTEDSGKEQDQEETPYALKVELVGHFEVDTDRFDVDNLDHWSRYNAPLLLYPYLREHAFALSARLGFTPVLLPLLQIPSSK